MKKTVSNKLGVSIAIIALISMVIGYVVLEFQASKIESAIYEDTIEQLATKTENKLRSKKAIGVTNAYSIANDAQIKAALKENKRALAIDSLGEVSKTFKNNTNFKNIKVHIHTKENISFLRNWKVNKYGDDLSSFRTSVVFANNNKKPAVGFEIGRAGLGLRAVVPVMNKGEHLGSLEFMQGLNSVAKAFNKDGDGFLLLMDETLKKAEVAPNMVFKNYVISQKFIKKDFLADAKTIDIAKLLQNKQLSSEKYFYSYVDVKDFQGKKLGIALVGKPIEKVYKAIDSAQSIIQTALILIAVLVAFIIVFLIVSIKKIVSNPLKELEDAIQSLIQSNDTSARVKVVSDDEIGQVASGFNDYLTHIDDGLKQDLKLIDQAEGVMAKVASGCFSQKITETTNNASLNMLKDNINKMIDETHGIYTNINELLSQYVKYNYTQELQVDGIASQGLLQQLIDSINSLKASITQMLVSNKTNGITLQNSSQELLDNVSTLSASSNEAAASLEETAAALEEVTSAITSNNENVTQMTRYAATVTDSASKGEQLANKTVSSIDQINNEVSSIAEAITVIDKIAFQTNILSLNAAVEAATAGEAGKGFAVVAQEVRNLAARSAESAKDIKDIVEKATTKAAAGKNIAEDMINGYEHLNSNIDKTIELIHEVETASKEQQSGIVQINDAVNSLDQQTQKNAVVASEANNIATSTQEIADDIVADANEKEFIGKDSIQAKKIAVKKSPSQPIQNISKAPSKIEKPLDNTSTKKDKTPIKPITSHTNDDDEWASF